MELKWCSQQEQCDTVSTNTLPFFLLLLYVYQFRMLNFVYISPSLSFSLPLPPFSLCIHPLIRYIIILSGVCDNGYFGCPIGISYCLGVGSFQYCIITNWCISDL